MIVSLYMFLFLEYSRIILNYLERIVLFDPIHMTSIIDLVAIIVETMRIDNGCFSEKEFCKLILK